MEVHSNLGIKSLSPNKTEALRDTQQSGLLQQSRLSQHSGLPLQLRQPQPSKSRQSPQSEQPQQSGQLHPSGQLQPQAGQQLGLVQKSVLPQQPRLPQQQAGQRSDLKQQSGMLQKPGQPQQSSPQQQPRPAQQQARQRPEILQQLGLLQKSGLPQQSSTTQQPRLPQLLAGKTSELPKQSGLLEHSDLTLQSPPPQQTRLPQQPEGPPLLQQSELPPPPGLPRQSGLPEQLGLPQQSGFPVMTPTTLSPSSLRMFRHPVPTSKGRIRFTDQFDQIVKTSEPNPPNTNSKYVPTTPHRNTPLTGEPIKLTIGDNKTNTTVAKHNSYDDTAISIKHKLPLTVVAPKGCYTKRPYNPVNKENRLTTGTAQTRVIRATQTEKVFIVTKESYEVLQQVKNSGLTKAELQKQLDDVIKQRKTNSENDCVVIDLENTEENNKNKDILDTVLKHSTNNKHRLIAAAHMMQLLKGQVPPTVPPANPSTASTSEPPPAEPVPLTTVSEPAAHSNSPPMLPCDELLKSFMVLATLQKFGFRLTNSALEPRHTYIPRTDLKVTQTTQTEDERDNSKRRKLHSTNENSSELMDHRGHNYQRPSLVQPPQELLPTVMPRREPELPVFQPNMPRQVPQAQQFVPDDHSEQLAQYYPPDIRGLMSQHRPPFTNTMISYQCPYELNRHSTLRSPQIQVQMASPVQPHVNGPRQGQNFRNQATRLPRLSRVLSTDEANMHSQAQHPEFSWGYPPMYGNVYTQINQ